MSFLFHSRTRKVMKVLWAIVAIFIIVGMVFFFAPGLPDFLFGLFLI